MAFSIQHSAFGVWRLAFGIKNSHSLDYGDKKEKKGEFLFEEPVHVTLAIATISPTPLCSPNGRQIDISTMQTDLHGKRWC